MKRSRVLGVTLTTVLAAGAVVAFADTPPAVPSGTSPGDGMQCDHTGYVFYPGGRQDYIDVAGLLRVGVVSQGLVTTFESPAAGTFAWADTNGNGVFDDEDGTIESVTYCLPGEEPEPTPEPTGQPPAPTEEPEVTEEPETPEPTPVPDEPKSEKPKADKPDSLAPDTAVPNEAGIPTETYVDSDGVTVTQKYNDGVANSDMSQSGF